MRVLLISPKTPYPIFGGLELRVYQLFRVLGRRHQVSLFCTSLESPDRETLEKLEDIFESVEVFSVTPQPVAPQKRRSMRQRVADLISPPIDYYDVVGYSETMRERIRGIIESSQFDVIHLMGIRMMKYVPDVRRWASVCDSVDDLALFCFRTIRYQRRIIDKARWVVDWLTAISYERRFARLFDEVTLVSPVDARVMRAICPSATVAVVPNGVDADHFRSKGSEGSEPIIMFSGVMDYEPNVTAVRYFCSAIFPRIRREVPEARFFVVGHSPGPEIRRLGETVPGVVVTGFVDDIRQYLDESLVYVAPIKSGAGIKNKILEAWAMEKPVVATSMSCDGIDVTHGENILIADSPAEFAKSVTALLGDRDLRARLRRNARAKVLEKYEWQSQADKMEEVYRRAVWKRARRQAI